MIFLQNSLSVYEVAEQSSVQFLSRFGLRAQRFVRTHLFLIESEFQSGFEEICAWDVLKTSSGPSRERNLLHLSPATSGHDLFLREHRLQLSVTI